MVQAVQLCCPGFPQEIENCCSGAGCFECPAEIAGTMNELGTEEGMDG